jgi:hypothetical protein
MKLKNHITWSGSALLLLLLALYSCDVDNLKYDDWKPVVAVPLAYSDFDVYDVLNRTDSLQELLVVDQDGLLALNYKGELFSFSLDELLDIPDQNYNQTLPLNPGMASSIESGLGASFSDAVEFPLNIEPNDVRVDEVVFLSGNVNLSYTILQDEVFEGSITFGNLVDQNNTPLSFSISSAGVNPGQTITESFDLTGARMSPNYDGTENLIALDFSISISNNPDNTAVSGDALSIEVDLSEINIDYITGYFGQLSINTDQDSVRIKIFDNIINGTFALEEAFIDLNVENSFGLPVDFSLDDVTSFNLETGEEIDLTFPTDLALEGQADLNGAPEEVTFSFNNGNTNVVDLLEPTPKVVYFALNATSNPNGPPPPDQPNFIRHDSRLDVGIDVLLPLKGYAQDILLIDTLDVDIEFDEFEEVDSIEFKIRTLNGFPTRGDVQVVFLDELMSPIDSLFLEPSPIILSGLVNSSGIVETPVENTQVVSVDQETSDNLGNTDKIVVIAVLNTINSQNEDIVRFMDDYRLKINLGAKIYGNIAVE